MPDRITAASQPQAAGWTPRVFTVALLFTPARLQPDFRSRAR